MEKYDVVIVGAGLWGLCAAHTFLKINPYTSLLIVDSKSSVGGVWAAEQIYPGLRANNLQTNYEFSDFPILDADVGVQPRGVLTGEALSQYLEKYAQHFDLTRHLRLETQVLSATEDPSCKSWTLSLLSKSGPSSISSSKLIIATGQASVPNPLPFPGLASFSKPIIHSSSLSSHAPLWLSSEKVNHVLVMGTSKSAHDAVYLFANAGKKVTWLIRRPGHGRGVVPMAKLHLRVGFWKVWRETLLLLRPLTWMGMAPWSTGDGFGWVRGWLERTELGNRVVVGYHRTASRMTGQQSGILGPGTEVLRPASFGLWYATQGNALNYERDFYGMLREKGVEILRDDVLGLEGEEVRLREGGVLRPDAVVCSTGYDVSYTVPLEPGEKRAGWGCPVGVAEGDEMFAKLEAKADEELFERFPLLRTSPPAPGDVGGLKGGTSPWRLWRFLAPPSQVDNSEGGSRNLVFLNAINCYQTTVKAELTSLWAYAYLHDRLAVATPTEEEARYEATLWSRFGKWRAPFGMQGKLADMSLEAVPYYDLLLRDLGLRSWRKGWGWFGEVFGGRYGIKDYAGVVDEWIRAQSQR